MDFIPNSCYKIIVEINGAVLTYKCKVLSSDDNFVTFIDDRNKEYTYNKKVILSSTPLGYEIDGGTYGG